MIGDGRPWALVTGGAKRVGRALAEAAAELGYAVAVHAHRSHDEGHVTVAAIESRGVPACLVQADLADPEQAADLVARLAAAGKAPTLLVNNAAIFEHDRLTTATAAAFDRHMAVNLKAPLLLSRAFVASLPEGAGGQIVNLVDQRVRRPSPHFLTYTLAKAGLWTLTETLARDLAPRIRVNAIAPGIALADVDMAPERAAALIDRFPLQRGGSVDDLVAAFRFLVETASVTGEMICVDGGAHLGRREG